MTCAKCWIPAITDYIGYYEDIISDNVCNKIMAYNWLYNESTYANHKGQDENSKERVKMNEVWVKEGMSHYAEIKIGVLKATKKYSKYHKNFYCHHHTDFRINRYSEGGFMSEHVDNIHHSHGQQYGYPVVSVLLYLNDNYEGGEFFVAEKEFKPKKGSAIIFPSNFMYPHEAKTVIKGIRWSIISWLM